MSTSFRFTVDEYDQMVRSGVFDGRADNRFELLNGGIVEVNPPGPPHAHVVSLLTYWSMDVTDRTKIWINVQNPIGISEFDSVPEPDLVWLHVGEYRNDRPTADDVLLLIEVSDTSLGKDRHEKGKLYADAGIQDYWIVNLNEKCVEVYRDPANGRFQSLATFGIDGVVCPLAAPETELQVRTLFD